MKQDASYDLPTKHALEMVKKPALFLDFDGTIRHSKSGNKFIQDQNDITLFDGVEEKLWNARNDGFLILGVTNQGGVAFMMRTPQQINDEIEATIALFDKNPFHGIKMSFHHPKGKHPSLGNKSLMRKPYIGMLVMHELDCYNAGYIIDYDNSIFVGDRPEDKQCAESADIQFQWAWDFFGFEKPQED